MQLLNQDAEFADGCSCCMQPIPAAAAAAADLLASIYI